MREFFVNYRNTLSITAGVILMLGIGFLIQYCNGEFRSDTGSDFANYTFVPMNDSNGKIWEVRTKSESVSFNPDEYHLYINIIDPENGKCEETIHENPRKVYASDIFLYHVNGKVWLISSGSDCPIINVYDANTYEKFMDIDEFENTHDGLQLGIEEITIDYDFVIRFVSAEKNYFFNMAENDSVISTEESVNDSVLNDGYVAKNNFIYHSTYNASNDSVIARYLKNSPDSFSQLVFHDNRQTIIFLKNLGPDYSLRCYNNLKDLKWEIKQEEFEDIIAENADLRVLCLPFGEDKLILDFRKAESGYSKETYSQLGMICVLIDNGEILWDWKAEKVIE